MAILLTLFIALFAWALQTYAHRNSSAHENILNLRLQAGSHLHDLHRNLSRLDNHLRSLSPQHPEKLDRLRTDLAVLEQSFRQLSESSWFLLNPLYEHFSDFAQGLIELHHGHGYLRQLLSSDPNSEFYPRKAMLEAGIDKLWKQLLNFEHAILSSQQDNKHFVGKLVDEISLGLYGLTLLVIAINILAYWLLNNQVLTPLTQIAGALKAGGHGDGNILLPRAVTHETRQLIDAFAEMRRQVDERQHALEHQALHDALTGLPNRILLHDRIDHLIHLAKHDHAHFALLVMDLDGFKEINDTLSHHIGDQLLKQVAKRICRIVQDRGTVSRLGGDEFAILLDEAEATLAHRIGQQLLHLFDAPFRIEKHSLYISCSLGIALYPNHGHNALGLARRADVAMYVAKRERNGIAIYDISQDKDNLERLEIANQLRKAIDEEALSLYYQPQIRLADEQCVGFEVLLRWQHPRQGYIQPDVFIQVAEQTGIIGPLTYWVLDKALAQCTAWQQRNIPFGTVAVNLSVFNLQDKALYRNVAKLLHKWGVEPAHLVLEITESAMMADPVQAMETLNQLSEIGVKVAIDDYGTGFSSLSYLKQLPIDKIKIDKSFVMDMSENENDEVIVRSTIDLAHNLGMRIIAEGVEDLATQRLLKTLNCDMAQGYYIGHPMPLKEAEQWLAENQSQEGAGLIPGTTPEHAL